VMSEMVPDRNIRMLEVRSGITNHAETFHYLPRPHIVWRGERHDLIKANIFEPETNGLFCASVTYP